MDPQRFQDKFTSGGSAFLVVPADGSPPRRLDGEPLTDYDRAILRGDDPLDVLPDAVSTSSSSSRPAPPGPDAVP